MRVKSKTIKLAKVRRQLRVLARRKYKSDYTPEMEKDINNIAIRIYKIIFNKSKKEKQLIRRQRKWKE